MRFINDDLSETSSVGGLDWKLSPTPEPTLDKKK